MNGALHRHGEMMWMEALVMGLEKLGSEWENGWMGNVVRVEFSKWGTVLDFRKEVGLP